MTTTAVVDTVALRRAMVARGESITTLANRSGVAKSSICGALNGSRASHPATIAALAAYLKVGAETLWKIEPGTRR